MNKIEKASWITFIIIFIMTITIILVFDNGTNVEDTQKALIYGNQQTINTLLLYNPSLYK